MNPEETFNYEKCETCGTCLSKCNYFNFTQDEAAREIANIKNGLHSIVLDKCAGCWSCDVYCPNNCRPYSLIRSRWHERIAEEGFPERARFLMPTQFPNFRSIVKHEPEEARFLEEIKEPPEGETVLYTGCNTLVIAKTLQSGILDGLPIFGSFDACCGEMYYRMGAFESARESGLKMKRIFSGLKAKKIVFACAAGMNMLTNVYPQEFGIDFEFESQLLTQWLEEKIDSGQIEIKNPLNRKVTVQDSCHAKVMDPDIHESPRRLLEKIGVEVVEMEKTKEDSMCCGVAAGCSRYSIVDLTRTGFIRVAGTRVPGPDITVSYCNGCLLTMAIMRQFMMWAPPVLPLIQLVQLAAGEEVDLGLTARRARQVLFGIAKHSLPKYLSRRRFQIDPIG